MFLLDNEKQHGWMDGIRQNLSQVRGVGGGMVGAGARETITALMTRLERNFPCPYLFCQV